MGDSARTTPLGLASGLAPAVLDPLRDLGGDDFIRTLMVTFVDHSEERLQNIQTAADERDGEALGRAVHSLRSASATLGAMELSRLAGRLEDLADNNEIDALLERLPELQGQIEELAGKLSSELGS